MGLAEEVTRYEDTAENHDERVKRFTALVNTNSILKDHRDFVEAHWYGFGERCFHWLWKLLVDEMPQAFSFLEVGVYCGQVLSLVPYLAKLQVKTCKAAGVTMLNSFSGVKGEFPLFPETDYRHHIDHILQEFGVPATLYVGDSTSETIHEQIQGVAPFDIVYIDGCHEYEYVKSDLEFYSRLVKPGSYLVIDDASCYLKIPWGMFSGIEPVSRATEEIIIQHPETWQECLALMHLRLFLRRN